MQMPYSPLDDLLNAREDVRKASKVRHGDDVSMVNKRVADVYMPIVHRIYEDCYSQIRDTHEKRVTELLEANNREVELRREANRRIKFLEALLYPASNVEF